MAAGGTFCRYNPADTFQENAEAGGEAGSLHERLVSYVHALQHGSRRGVWGEHSYARARHSAGGGAGRARSLLAPRAPSPPASPLRVDGPASAPPSPPAPAAPPQPADETDPADEHEDDWEERLAALAPSPAHARLAAAAADALHAMRLERLVSGGGRRAAGEARAAAARLRRALAPYWLLGASGARPAPAWLHAALTANLPRAPRRLYEEVLGALRQRAPRLAERLTGSWAPPPPEPARALGPPVPPQSEPWLVWVSSGCAALDARWERRLAGLVHTRVLRAGAGSTAAPEAWCAAAAGAVRSQLTDALAEAGDRPIILGGVGAGAALCLLLARGAGGAGRAAGGVRGAVLAAPPLRTAEGGRGARDDALRAVRLPLLLVVGTRASDAPRAIAHDVCERAGAGAGAGGGAGARRVLEVHGADGALRLGRRARRRLRLPQHALDAALAEECVRWAIETAEGEEAPPSPPAPRRLALPSIVQQIDLDLSEEDYAHLPHPAAPAPAPAPAAAAAAAGSAQNARSIEIVEGRVVSAPPAAPAPCPSPADIMQMPIVFADDAAADSSSAGSPVTVTSGKARGAGGAGVKMTRVILAKRGAGVPPAPAPAAGPAPPPLLARRRLLVRRGAAGGARLLARHPLDKSH